MREEQKLNTLYFYELGTQSRVKLFKGQPTAIFI